MNDITRFRKGHYDYGNHFSYVKDMFTPKSMVQVHDFMLEVEDIFFCRMSRS